MRGGVVDVSVVTAAATGCHPLSLPLLLLSQRRNLGHGSLCVCTTSPPVVVRCSRAARACEKSARSPGALPNRGGGGGGTSSSFLPREPAFLWAFFFAFCLHVCSKGSERRKDTQRSECSDVDVEQTASNERASTSVAAAVHPSSGQCAR